jgi:hypothetical protein
MWLKIAVPKLVPNAMKTNRKPHAMSVAITNTNKPYLNMSLNATIKQKPYDIWINEDLSLQGKRPPTAQTQHTHKTPNIYFSVYNSDEIDGSKTPR